MGIYSECNRAFLLGLGTTMWGVPALAAPAAPNIITIQNPGGGTIAYTQLPGQQTVRSVMIKALTYAGSQFGGRPQIARVLRSPDGTSVEVIFSIAGKDGQQMEGLAIACVPTNGLAEGAVLSDISSRFLSTIKPMIARLQTQTGSAGGPAPAPASGSTNTPSAMPAAAGPAAPLHRVAFPDGSGAMGLPDGWTLTRAAAGDVSAKGPHGELLRFGLPVSVIDPTDPRSRALGRGPGGTAPGNFVDIRYGVDGATAFKSAVVQLYQKQHKTPPVCNISVDEDLHDTGGGRSYFLFGDVDLRDGQGSQATWAQVGMSTRMALGAWQMTVFQVTAPKSLAAQEMATVQAMFKSYQPNVAGILQQLAASGAQRDAIFKSSMRSAAISMDNGDRQTAGMSNFLRNNTVIRDNDLNGHATVSDALGDALVQDNPNRYQVVPTSQYIKGIDY